MWVKKTRTERDTDTVFFCGDSGTKVARKTIKKERILPINVHTRTVDA